MQAHALGIDSALGHFESIKDREGEIEFIINQISDNE